MISGDKETVEEVLQLFTIQQKMRTEMLKDVDRKVSDEEAAQKAMQYVAFTYSEESKSEDSESTSDTKEEAKTKADTFLDAVKGGTDFEQAAKDQETSALDLTFDSETTSPNEEVIAAADKLDAGQVTDVIETDSGYYVAKVTSTLIRQPQIIRSSRSSPNGRMTVTMRSSRDGKTIQRLRKIRTSGKKSTFKRTRGCGEESGG